MTEQGAEKISKALSTIFHRSTPPLEEAPYQSSFKSFTLQKDQGGVHAFHLGKEFQL